VVMFELPLFPHMIAYGRIQRGLAAKYEVWLIPKRFFAEGAVVRMRLQTFRRTASLR